MDEILSRECRPGLNQARICKCHSHAILYYSKKKMIEGYNKYESLPRNRINSALN